ncbi:winged helix-turn-helix transcriptional regulator [Pseudomonas sp. hsmgli-8]|uniref:Winged helix-turn-helix transcriptional regulator n=1 Tax=Pseudomonas quercus TaxID=2722792 RepID=A0ABX0YKM3_9PSED|nr:winged helix-turn-helix domain-containing protein [Pseudomonas quercus]NJP03505.1 winged helix-turn-helix transcriptional regulator [Pseudomonas quercus]
MHAKPHGRKVRLDTLAQLATQISTQDAPQHKAIALQLRTAIVEGILQPGDNLTQQAIANAFGVSRMPVREALRTLEAQGYLQGDKHKAYVVTDVSAATWPEDLPGLLRAVTEQYAACETEQARQVFGHQVMECLASLNDLKTARAS